ncbi:AMP-binding protein [Rhodococcus hoagii]|nr:AMP-binding protein [Prescottella equi]
MSSAPSSARSRSDCGRCCRPRGGRWVPRTGLTESSSAATLATAADLAERPDTVGTAVPTMRVEVRDEVGRPVPDGVEGEIYLRGPLVMLGY